MTDRNIDSIDQLYIHNSLQICSESVVRSYQSIYHSRLSIKHSITALFHNLFDEFQPSNEINKIYKIIVDILTKLYSTLNYWQKCFNNKLSTALYLLRKLNNYQNEYQLQQKYHNQELGKLPRNNQKTPLIIQLEQEMNHLKEKQNIEIIEYNKLIMTLKFNMFYFNHGIIFFDANNAKNIPIGSRLSRSSDSKFVMFYKWIDKLKKYFVIYFKKDEQNITRSFNAWKTNLKLLRTVSLSTYPRINIDEAKHTDANYLRDQYTKITSNIKEFYKHLLDRITLDIDENRNIYNEKYNYKKHVNELDNEQKKEIAEKLLDNIRNLRNQLDSYKVKINDDFKTVENLQRSLLEYTNNELVDRNKTLKTDLEVLGKNIKLWKLKIIKIEWIIAVKESVLDDIILEYWNQKIKSKRGRERRR